MIWSVNNFDNIAWFWNIFGIGKFFENWYVWIDKIQDDSFIRDENNYWYTLVEFKSLSSSSSLFTWDNKHEPGQPDEIQEKSERQREWERESILWKNARA